MVREMSQEECWALLGESFIGRLGCHAEGETYVVPISFALDGKRIVGQTTVGKKVQMMRANPKVCVQVDKGQALDDWQSVILWGEFRELSAGEKPAAARALIDKLSGQIEAEGRSPRDVTPDKVSGRYEGVVYEIRIERMTGRAESPDS
jgi:nitroimidazol reductase NimA-like FMN-containing flavoprotein (pyridoxamine 5'-phosphate oxidase superfamily)